MTMTSGAIYLDPKADITFKKVFGRNPDLLISLLNALLPLRVEEQIVEIEYLPVELLPVDVIHKDTIVDVRCKDKSGRQFVVEMQMAWTVGFKNRVVFNASKAYVDQAGMGFAYENLQPVYSLNIVNAVFEPNVEEFIHNYSIVHDKYTDKVLEGLHFTFVELPKFKPQSVLEKRMAVLWLRFLTEINSTTRVAPMDLMRDPETSRALEILRISAFNSDELNLYDKFWDRISRERTLCEENRKAGWEKGHDDGFKEGEAIGLEKGEVIGVEKGVRQVARKMISMGLSAADVAQATGLSASEIESLCKEQ